MPDSQPTIDAVVAVLRSQFGDDWDKDSVANNRYQIEVSILAMDVEGAHLVTEPDLDEHQLEISLWLDFAIEDLLHLDDLAYEVFGRISKDLFYAERRIVGKTIRYPFVTGTAQHGHRGVLVLTGPHAADFVSRQHLKSVGPTIYQA